MVRPTIKDRSLVRKRSCVVRVRDEQYKRWEAMARKHGQSVSEWLRYVADRAARTG